MSCAYSRGVYLCQTDVIGVVAVLTVTVLALALAYYIGRTGYLQEQIHR